MSLWWVFGFFLLERGAELWMARRNRRLLLARGGREFFPESYLPLALMHVLFFVVLIAESWPWRVPIDPLTLGSLAVLVLTQALRYWCVAALGAHWNTRIVIVPGAPAIRKGPYRLLRHPNYFAVTVEIAVLPLLARAPLTLFAFSLANLVLLRRRIALEERALREHTDYGR